MRNSASRIFIASSAIVIAFMDVCLIRNSPAGVRAFGELALGIGLQLSSLAALYALTSASLLRIARLQARYRVGMGMIALGFLFVFSPDIVAGACYNVGDNKLVNGENRRRAREQCCLVQFSNPALE